MSGSLVGKLLVVTGGSGDIGGGHGGTREKRDQERDLQRPSGGKHGPSYRMGRQGQGLYNCL